MNGVWIFLVNGLFNKFVLRMLGFSDLYLGILNVRDLDFR